MHRFASAPEPLAEDHRPDADGVIRRAAGRVVLLAPDHRVLLLRCVDPSRPEAPAFWSTPGGGLKPGERFEDAALRELAEETGITGATLGPCLWHRVHAFTWMGRPYEQTERFFLARAGAGKIRTTGRTPLERASLVDHRWWGVADIARETRDRFAPSRLADLLAGLDAVRPPASPRDISEPTPL